MTAMKHRVRLTAAPARVGWPLRHEYQRNGVEQLVNAVRAAGRERRVEVAECCAWRWCRSMSSSSAGRSS